jgi:prolyl oligopeptidase
MVPSTDGAQVPLSILCQKQIKLDGSHPTLYEGYGSYGISEDPHFDPRTLAWIERGGVTAFVHARGGGEFGEKWHQAGQKKTKQHTIDDMIAAARYLIDQGYSSPAHLSTRGTSAGGIAVGGAITQHPELFAAAIDNVGMTDALHFQSTQGGAANVPEFGDVARREDYEVAACDKRLSSCRQGNEISRRHGHYRRERPARPILDGGQVHRRLTGCQFE